MDEAGGQELSSQQPVGSQSPPSRNLADRVQRRRLAAVAGHEGDSASARAGMADPDPTVRATALGALARLGGLDVSIVALAERDTSPVVRRRLAEVLATRGLAGLEVSLLALLEDPDATVVEAAAFAAGERHQDGRSVIGGDTSAVIVGSLETVARTHADPLAREAAVAAMGAIGLEACLPVLLDALEDKVAIRRRAVLALAAFDGDRVEAALHRALEDRDWQVRQSARDLL